MAANAVFVVSSGVKRCRSGRLGRPRCPPKSARARRRRRSSAPERLRSGCLRPRPCSPPDCPLSQDGPPTISKKGKTLILWRCCSAQADLETTPTQIVGSIQRTTSAASPTHSSSASSSTARPTRPALATQSSPASSTAIARSRTATVLSSTTVKARVKLTGGASFADGSGLAPATPLSPSAGHNWSDGGSDVGSAVGPNTSLGSTGRRAPSPGSSFAGGMARSVATSSLRLAGPTVNTNVRPGQVHARSSPVAPTVGSRHGSAGPPRHVRSNSAGLNALLPSLSSPASRSGTPNVSSSTLSAYTLSRPLTASVRASMSAPRGQPSASAPSSPFHQVPPLVPSGSRLPPSPTERGSGAESPPQYFSQQQSDFNPEDYHLSHSPPPTLPPLPSHPAELASNISGLARDLPASTPIRRSGAVRRSSASSISSSTSPDSRISPSTSSGLSQPVSTSSFSSVSYDPPPVSPGFLNSLPSIPSTSHLDETVRSPQETIKQSLINRNEGHNVEDPLDEHPLSKQEEEDAKVNRKVRV